MSPKKKEEEDDEEDFPRVTKAEITDDGALVVKFDRYVSKGKKEAVFMPEALLAIAQEYGEMDTEGDFVGLIHVYEEAIFGDEDEEDEDDDLENGQGGDQAESQGGESAEEKPADEIPDGVPEDIFNLDGEDEEDEKKDEGTT